MASFQLALKREQEEQEDPEQQEQEEQANKKNKKNRASFHLALKTCELTSCRWRPDCRHCSNGPATQIYHCLPFTATRPIIECYRPRHAPFLNVF
jgi:hypothetical protein